MVDSEYSTYDYKFPKISIRAIMKNPEILKFILDHIKTKKVCTHAFKKLSFVIRYIPDCYKTQGVYHKVISEDPFMLVYCLDRHSLMIV